jgi:polar amino acid transport system substrate-binding protein
MSWHPRVNPLIVALISLTLLLAGGNFWSVASAAKGHHHSSAQNLHLIHPGYFTVCSDTTYPPMEYGNPNHPGQYIGADVDLANALAHAMGLKGAIIVSHVFDTIIPAMLDRHLCDAIMSSMSNTPARRKLVTFVNYMRAEEAIVVRRKSSIHANGYQGLCGHSVSVESGTTELFGLEAANAHCVHKITIRSFTEDTAAYEAFAAGHVEAYTTDYPVAALYVKKSPGMFRLAGRPFVATGPYGIALPKSAHALKHALEMALRKIRANGEYMRILRKWGIAAAALK